MLYLDLVDVTPAPILARLDRLHDGMLRLMKVLGRMFVLGRITTTDMATFEAYSEMNPRVTLLQALLASCSARMHFAYGLEMRADCGCHGVLPLRRES